MTTRVLFDNRFETVTPTGAQLGSDYLDYTAYQPTIADAASDTVTGGTGDADCVFFRGTLDGCTIDIKSGATTVATVTDDDSIAFFTTSNGAYTYVINNATGSEQTPTIRNIIVGEYLDIPAQEVGFTDPRLSRDAKLTTNHSDTGVMLGRSLQRQSSKFTIDAKRMDLTLAHGRWLDFIIHAEVKPFVFYQSTGDAVDLVWTWVEKMIASGRYSDCDQISQSVSVRGLVL